MADICYPSDTDWSAAYPKESEYEKAREANEAMFEMAEMYAWSVLASLTNYRIGTCPITVRPCVQRALVGTSYLTAVVGRGNSGALGLASIGQFNPYKTGGSWVNGCGCQRSCECSTLPEVYVPGPVTKIVDVRVDGEIVPRSAYKIFDGNRLVRVDDGTWPLCQDLAATDDDAFTITYYRGAFPNAMVRFAAGVLANEYLLDFNHSEECRLPETLRSLSRSGESYDFEVAPGKTGITEVDRVIDIYNPHALRAPVIVASADDYPAPIQTWGRRRA